MRNCGIYRITNTVNGKVIVGQSINIHERMYKLDRNEHFNRAVKVYGKDNFKSEILLYCDEEHLDFYERLFIEKMDLMNPEKGYNKESGGNENKAISEETRKKQRDSHLGQVPVNKGKHHSEEHKQNLKKAWELRKARGDVPYNKGKTLSENHKKKLSDAKKGNKNSLGRTHSEESKNKMRDSRIGKTPWNKGIPTSLSTILKMSKPIISEDNTLFFISNKKANEAGYGHAYDVANPNNFRTHCKGIVFRYATLEEIKEKLCL